MPGDTLIVFGNQSQPVEEFDEVIEQHVLEEHGEKSAESVFSVL